MPSRMHEENISQAGALQALVPSGDVLCEVRLCELFGADWRHIINEFEAMHGRVPTAEDLIWISSQHLGEDIRRVAQRLETG